MMRKTNLSKGPSGKLLGTGASLKLLAVVLAACFWVSGESAQAEVTLTKETEMTDFALWYSESDRASIISPHGDCLTIVNDYIFAVWYAGPLADGRVHISRKKIGEDNWVDMKIDGAKNRRADSHRTVNVGVCPIDGTIHVAFDHHGTKFRYLHSVKGAAFVPDSEWKPSLIRREQSDLSGTELPQVTYPQFWNNEKGELMMAYRRYGATGGEVTLSAYDGNRWSEPKIMIDGYRTGRGNFYAYNEFYNYFGKNYFLGTLRSSAVSGRNVGVFYAAVDGETATGDFFRTREGRRVNAPIASLAAYNRLKVLDPELNSNLNNRHLVVTSDGTHYIAHNSRVYVSKPGEETFTQIKGTGGTLLGIGNKVFSFVVSGGVDKVSLYDPETDNWDRVYTGASGRGINKYFTVRPYKNKIIAIVLRNGDRGPRRPINCIEIDTGEPDPTAATAPTYGNGGTPGTGEAWPITRSATTRIEAENYDQAEATATFSDTTAGNTGEEYRADNVDIGAISDGGESGYNIGWTKSGEWLQYTIDVERTGLYDVTFRYSRAGEGSSALSLTADGRAVGETIDADSSGDWGVYTTVTETIELEAGIQGLRLRFEDGSINVNWFEISPAATPVITLSNLGTMAPWDADSTWSDGSAAHGAADYVVPASGNLISPNSTTSFPGYSLTIEKGGRFQVRSHETENETITVESLLFEGGSSYSAGDFAELSAGSGSDQTNVLGGSIVNSGTTRILTFDKVGGNPFNRGLRILSLIEGDGRLQAWEGQGGQGGDLLMITNEENSFAGIWEAGAGSKLLFTNKDAVGSAAIHVLADSELEIQGNWNGGTALVVADTADTGVTIGDNFWRVASLSFGGNTIEDGTYTAAELNALGSNAVFVGTGGIRVGAGGQGGPVAHWKFDERSGTVANDSSGSGYTGTIEGATWESDASRSSYLSFDGTDDRVETLFQTDLSSMIKDFTWSAWVNNQAAPANGVILGNRRPDLNENLNFLKLTSRKVDSVLGGAGQSIEFDDMAEGGWHHHALVKSGSNLAYYRDGVLSDRRELTSLADGVYPFFIGGDASSGASEHFQGFIDDVIIYDRALELPEITEVMNAVETSALEDWRVRYFGTAANTGQSSDIADADADGESNFLEFATNQDPGASTYLDTPIEIEGEMIQFRYTRSKAAMADGVSYQVKWSDSLQVGSWESAGVTESMESETADEMRFVAEIPMSSERARFIQLEVSR